MINLSLVSNIFRFSNIIYKRYMLKDYQIKWLPIIYSNFVINNAVFIHRIKVYYKKINIKYNF